jgi:hypothetical protein
LLLLLLLLLLFIFRNSSAWWDTQWNRWTYSVLGLMGSSPSNEGCW